MKQHEEPLNPQEPLPQASEEKFGTSSAFTCPDCGGALWELDEGGLLQYRCRVGHAYSPIAMLDAESEMVEKALWGAVRILKESASLCRQLAMKISVMNESFHKRADEREHYADVITEFLATGNFRS